MIQPDSYDDAKVIFTEEKFERLEQKIVVPNCTLDTDIFEQLKGKSIDEMITFLNFKKYELGRDGKRSSDEYKIMEILEEVIINFNDEFANMKSETTFYRKCASILDIILRDTNLVLIDKLRPADWQARCGH